MERVLRQSPIAISLTWSERRYTSNPPKYDVSYSVWNLGIGIVADEPFVMVSLLRSSAGTQWAFVRRAADTDGDLSVMFSPPNPTTADEVHVQFGRAARRVVDADLKADPQRRVLPGYAENPTMGVPVLLASDQASGLAFGVLVLARTDMQRRRGHRWRIRPDLAGRLSPGLRELGSGHQAGFVATGNDEWQVPLGF